MSRLDVDKRLSTQAYVCRFTDGRRHDSRVAAANVYFVAAFLLQFSAARPEGSFATTKATLQRQNCQSVLHLRLQNSRIDQALIPQVAFATAVHVATSFATAVHVDTSFVAAKGEVALQLQFFSPANLVPFFFCS